MPGMIVPMVVGAVGAKIASNSAKKAAKQQQEAADRALAFNQRVYDEQRALMRPFVNTGTDIYQRLAENYARGAYSPGGPSAFGQGSPFAAAMGDGGMGYVSGPRMTQGTPAPVTQAVPRIGLASAMPMPGGNVPGPGGRPMPAPIGGGSSMVMLQAPTGETRAVPADQAQRFVALGARVVG